MQTKAIGDIGEDFTAKLYESMGFTVTERNYHSRYGEIDVIAENDEFLCFIEVKTRKPSTFGTPAAAVDKRKQKKLTLTAMTYLAEKESFKQPRFDVVEIWQSDGKIIRHNLIENAFWAEDFGGQYEIF